MSKLTKLVKNPRLFLSDMIYKITSKSYDTNERSLNNKQKISKSTPIKNEKKNLTIITSHARLFSRISHLLHTGEGMTHGPSHLEQWVSEFVTSKVDFAILIRNIDLYKWASDRYPYLDIIYAKNPIDVENILSNLPLLKAIYYFSNTGNLIHTLRYNIYQHIFLGHGDSDKSASAHKFFRVYDEVWVAGQAHIDRFNNADFKTNHIRFVKIGRPGLKNIVHKTLQNNTTVKSNDIEITYLPTWEGVYEENNYSSAHISVLMLSEVHKKLNCKIKAKYHPVTGSRVSSLKELPLALRHEFLDKNGMLEIADKNTAISDLIVGCEAFICDISAVVSECISSQRPIFVYIPEDREIKKTLSNMSYEKYAYIFNSIPQLIELLEDVLINGNDPLKEMRLEALDYLLCIDATINNVFNAELNRFSSLNNTVVNPRNIVIQ